MRRWSRQNNFLFQTVLVMGVFILSLYGDITVAAANADSEDSELRIHRVIPKSSPSKACDSSLVDKSDCSTECSPESKFNAINNNFNRPDTTRTSRWLDQYTGPNLCSVTLCHGTCANGTNANRLDFSRRTNPDGTFIPSADAGEMQGISAPCPLRTFKHLLTEAASAGGCCAGGNEYAIDQVSQSSHDCCAGGTLEKTADIQCHHHR